MSGPETTARLRARATEGRTVALIKSLVYIYVLYMCCLCFFLKKSSSSDVVPGLPACSCFGDFRSFLSLSSPADQDGRRRDVFTTPGTQSSLLVKAHEELVLICTGHRALRAVPLRRTNAQQLSPEQREPEQCADCGPDPHDLLPFSTSTYK